MSLAELLPKVQELPRPEKLRLMHILVDELAREEDRILADGSYPVWSPFKASEAAATLLKALEAEKAAP